MYTELENVKEVLSNANKGVANGLIAPNGKKMRSRLQPSTERIRKQFNDLSDFMSNPNLFTALKKAGNDEQLLRRASTHPKAFLRGEGVIPPPRTDVKIVYSKKEKEGNFKGKITITVTVEGCVPIGVGKACFKADGTAEWKF